MFASLLTLFLFALALPAHAETLQWAGGGKTGGYLGVLHHGIRGVSKNGDTVWMTGDYNRYVSRYVALDWTIGRDEPGQIKMDGYGSLCLDAGDKPKAGKSVQVWECSSSRAAAQTWVFAENQSRSGDTQLCIEVQDGENTSGEAHEGNIRLAECRSSRFGQWWRSKDPSRSFTVQGPLWV